MKKLVNGTLVDLTPEEIAELNKPVPFSDQKKDKLAALAARRYKAETGGIVLNGSKILTDRGSQAMINGAYALASRHVADADFTLDFKGADGWVTLTATQMIAISDAVGQHVQSCFKRERALSALLDAAQTTEALDAVNIDAGWPGQSDHAA